MRYMDEDLDVDMGHPRLDATTVLVLECFATHGLRLDVDAVRRWSRQDEDVARAWIEGEGAASEPPVITAARSAYARAQKCRRCGCTHFYRCDGGCVLEGDVCSRCREQ